MKRTAFAIFLVLLAANARGAEKWWDAYNRGVTAVNGKSYDAAVVALQKAIAENPTESTGVRAGNSIITYVPHFFLGIARFNLGDTDGALREWKLSEDQGAVVRTAYYARLKEWVARAQTQKQRDAQNAAAGPKKEAETALSRAVQMQGDAMSAGGDRTNSYREAQRKLQDALSQFRKAGTDGAAFKAVEQTAVQAIALFSTAVEEGRKLKAAGQVKPKPDPDKPIEVVIPFDDPVTETVTPAPGPVESQSKVSAEIAVQEYRRAIMDAQTAAQKGPPVLQTFLRSAMVDGEGLRARLRGAKSDTDYDRVRIAAETRNAEMTRRIAELSAPPPEPDPVPVPTPGPAPGPVTPTPGPAPGPGPSPLPAPTKIDVTPAYRAFATGDLAGADQLLTGLLASNQAAEAYLLRGCVRYTRAMLSRAPDALLASATEDFRSALRRNRTLRLDPRVFSPKLVARFEQIRNGG